MVVDAEHEHDQTFAEHKNHVYFTPPELNGQAISRIADEAAALSQKAIDRLAQLQN